MNAFALMAHHKPQIDYTCYCDDYYRVHLSGLISEIEISKNRFYAADSRSLEESALIRRIDRLFERQKNKKAPLELINISGQCDKQATLVLLGSLYDIEQAHIKSTGQFYLNLFPEIALSANRLEHVNLITFITLGKLFGALGYSWTYVKEHDASLGLQVYIAIYHDRLINGWNPTRQLSEWAQVQSEGSLWPNQGAVGNSMLAKGFTDTNTSARDARTASSTAAQEVKTNPNTPSTAQEVRVITDIDSDGPFDYASDD